MFLQESEKLSHPKIPTKYHAKKKILSPQKAAADRNFYVNSIKFDQCLFIINSLLLVLVPVVFATFSSRRRTLLIIPFLMCCLLLYPGLVVSAYENNKNVLIIRNICSSRGRCGVCKKKTFRCSTFCGLNNFLFCEQKQLL